MQITKHTLLSLLILLIGLHSCMLGLVMLVAPQLIMNVFGMSIPESLFFPSQSGIFLIILSGCYLYALKDPGYIKVIIFSKSLAVIFLVVEVAVLNAPTIIWAAAAGDFSMLVAVVIMQQLCQNITPESQVSSPS